MNSKKLDLDQLQDVSLKSENQTEEKNVKLQLFVTETTKKQLDLIKITDNRKIKDILQEIVEAGINKMAEEKGIVIQGDQIAIKKDK